MEQIGILVVSYGSRAAAMVDAFCRGEEYDVDFYIADKQRNPFNFKRAKEHRVVPSLDVHAICKFAKRFKGKIHFGIVGPEKPIINGVRDLVEEETGIQMICPTKEYAIEGSKVAQRNLFQEAVPEVNPRFKIFNPTECRTIDHVKTELRKWLDELDNRAVVKPDAPAAGKGVGVWGDHFNTREELIDHFLSNYKEGSVIVEEKIEGEESSFQAFCDGRHLVCLPETRDYKRAFDGDKGPNTGGMGSYEDTEDYLPFMTLEDRQKEEDVIERIFQRLKGRGSNTGLRGVPFYEAFIHTGKGPKILENNSRPGDPEIQNILPILKDDFVDICFRMIEGNLTKIDIDRKATVVTYKVPPNYGGYADSFPNRVNLKQADTPVTLDEAEELATKYGDDIRIYPAAMEVRDGENYALRSRAICVVGLAESIAEAREISLEGMAAIKGGALWNRNDIASKEHITKSMKHMEQLRRS
jgi:phosphoribosylamine--glycine ligase